MLHYTVTVADPQGHYFDVALVTTLDMNARSELLLQLPAWIPGSYLIREFARHIITVEAEVSGQPCPVEKLDKDTWRLELSATLADQSLAVVKVDWRVYAWDLSVRGAHLDCNHGFFNGTSLFLKPLGFEQTPIRLTIRAPKECCHSTWSIACGLVAASENTHDATGCSVLAPGGEASFIADDYDALIDHPVEMAELTVQGFTAHGVKHLFAVYGADDDLDLNRICEDLKPVCEAQIALFEPQSRQAPFSEYWFLVHATDNGYGGLEHRNSTALLCSREDLPQLGVSKAPKGYETFLGLCSHEYFHAWNVKRMKPAAFVPYDLRVENYTSLLWIFEGFTSYYDDLMLARTHKMDEEAYLKALGKTMAHVHKNRGHLVQSAAESSFDAWTKYYRQDENASNAVVSYYTKGALIAFCLDAHIRKQSGGTKSLDDAMRLMWAATGSTGLGLTENAFPRLVKEATGVTADQEILSWAYRREDLPVEAMLDVFGYTLEKSCGEDTVFVGMTVQFKSEGMLIKSVLNGSPAHSAGISAGDVLIAIDGKRLTESNYKRRLAACKQGQALAFIGFRAERLMNFQLIAAPAQISEWRIKKAESIQGALKAPWLP